MKILDFGLAKLTGDKSPYVNRQGDLSPDSGGDLSPSTLPTHTADTTPGLVMGTVGYMSPRAFQGSTPADTMTAILDKNPPDLLVAVRHIPPGLARLVDRCVEKSPVARFQSTRDLG